MIVPLRDRIASFFYGLTLPIRALRLILSRPVLLVGAALPIVLTLALSIWGVAWVKAKLVALGTSWLATYGYAPTSLTVQVAVIFLQIVLFVMAAVSFSLVAGIIASPLNDFLAETTEKYCEPPLANLPLEAKTIRWKIRAVWIDITKTFLVAVLQLALLVVGVFGFWIPGLNLIPLLLTFWLFTFQFVSYPQTRRGEDFRTSMKFLFRHAFASMGFGAAIGTLFAVPILSAFVLPLAVVGGTLLYARSLPGSGSYPLR